MSAAAKPMTWPYLMTAPRPGSGARPPCGRPGCRRAGPCPPRKAAAPRASGLRRHHDVVVRGAAGCRFGPCSPRGVSFQTGPRPARVGGFPASRRVSRRYSWTPWCTLPDVVPHALPALGAIALEQRFDEVEVLLHDGAETVRQLAHLVAAQLDALAQVVVEFDPVLVAGGLDQAIVQVAVDPQVGLQPLAATPRGRSGSEAGHGRAPVPAGFPAALHASDCEPHA